jgi:AcrR family transcriptional regulator
MSNPSRSRSAILSGAKIVIAQVGSYESNMIDIAAKAQVSRATVYNHFADKEEMMLSLVESEILRLTDLAKRAPSPGEALFKLASEISNDPALATMRRTDPQDIAKFVTASDHPLWKLAVQSTELVFGIRNSGLVLHWLLAQIGAPLTADQARHQADQLAAALAS